MSPAEFNDLWAGYQVRQEHEWERWAWHAAHIINISGKSVRRRVKPKELLGRGGGSFDPIAREMAKKQIAEKLKKREVH